MTGQTVALMVNRGRLFRPMAEGAETRPRATQRVVPGSAFGPVLDVRHIRVIGNGDAMSTMQQTESNIHARRSGRASPPAGWVLLAGGVAFFIGGSMHPGDDPPGLTLKEHLHLLYTDPAWYPSHAVLLVGMVLMAAALVALVRNGTLTDPRVQKVGAVAAGAAVLGALGMLLHLVAASEADRIAAGQTTPITDVQLVVESFAVPAFGLAIAALALIGASTRTLGNRVIAVLAVVIGYGLAGGTLLFTDALNFLFPAAGGIGLWAIAAGIGLLRRAPVATPALSAA